MYDKPLLCDPPNGYLWGFPKIYDAAKNPDFFKWLIEEGYPQSEIDKYGKGNFYCRWMSIEGKNE
jgi:microsomal dipeptidase-like Zn-dependent dipeptidase